MLLLTICFHLVSTTLSIPEKHLMVDDMERGNVHNEQRIKYESNYQQQTHSTLPQQASPTSQNFQMEYGFRPMKNAPQYVAKNQYNVDQYQRRPFPLYQQDITPSFMAYQPLNHKEHQIQLQQLADNYLRQYYLQPHLSSSNTIETLLNPKANLQYIMYVQPESLQSGASTLQTQLSSPLPYQGDKVQYQFVNSPSFQPQPTYIHKSSPQPRITYTQKDLLQPQVTYLQKDSPQPQVSYVHDSQQFQDTHIQKGVAQPQATYVQQGSQQFQDTHIQKGAAQAQVKILQQVSQQPQVTYLQKGSHQPQITYVQQGSLQPQVIPYVQKALPKPQITYAQKTSLKSSEKFGSSSSTFGPKSLLDSYIPSYLQVKYINQVNQVQKLPERTLKRTLPSHSFSKNFRPDENV